MGKGLILEYGHQFLCSAMLINLVLVIYCQSKVVKDVLLTSLVIDSLIDYIDYKESVMCP